MWVKKVGGGTSVQTRDKQYDRGQQKTGRWETVDWDKWVSRQEGSTR